MPNFFSKLGQVAKTTGAGFFPEPAGSLFSSSELQRTRGQGLMRFGTALLSGADTGEAITAAEKSYSEAQATLLAQKKAARDQAQDAARDAIGKKYAASPNDTPASLALKYPAMMQDYLAAGDLEAASKLEPLVNKILGGNDWQTVQLGDRVVFANVKTHEVVDGPERHMNADELRLRNLSLQERMMAMQMQHDDHMRAVGMTAQNAFVRQNAKLIDTEQKWSNWKASYDQALAGNPEAYKSAIINFVSMADPGTQIRLGMLQYASQLDPSLKGGLSIFAQKNVKGVIPPDVLAGMMQHAAELHAGTVDIYRKRYESRVRANPSLQAYLDPPEVAFPMSYNLPSEIAESRRLQQNRPPGETPRMQEFMPKKGKNTPPVQKPNGAVKFDWSNK